MNGAPEYAGGRLAKAIEEALDAPIEEPAPTPRSNPESPGDDDCPLSFLGHREGYGFVITPSGEVRSFKHGQLNRSRVVDLFNGDTAWLREVVLERHLHGLIGNRVEIDDLPDAISRAFLLARHAAEEQQPQLARQAATALYNVTTAAGLHAESRTLNSTDRLSIARMVVQHRLQPFDPLDPKSDPSIPDEGVFYDPGLARST